MVRFVLAGVLCFLAIQDAHAAKPAPKVQPSSSALGRKQIEAVLQSPADLDFGTRQTVTVGDLLDLLHKRHHLSIRFDIPSLANMYGLSVGGGSDKMIANRSSHRPTLAAGAGPNGQTAAPLAILTQTLAKPIRQSTYYAPPQAMPPAATAPVPVAASNAPTAGLPAAPVAKDTGPTAGYPNTGYPAPVVPALPNGPAPPESCQRPETHAAPVKESDTMQQFFLQAGKIEVPVATIDGQTITVATALRLALDAFPDINAEDSPGMPLAMTDATLLDFLVEDDGILITTRLKALTYKETRVYSVKNSKDLDLHELSTVICQSVRPWSWRSRIDELGEQLKRGTTSVPPAALTALVKSATELVADQTGITMTATDEKPAHPSDDMQQAAMIGNAVANGIVTLAHLSLNAVEVIHYADPPTGSIRVLGGKLVITQSQAAHREIAELLRQLGDE